MDLDGAWRRALEQAWQSFLAGTTPVGAVTTLEPCCMCLGAAVQTTITRLHFAGRDPYGGASGLVVDTPQPCGGH